MNHNINYIRTIGFYNDKILSLYINSKNFKKTLSSFVGKNFKEKIIYSKFISDNIICYYILAYITSPIVTYQTFNSSIYNSLTNIQYHSLTDNSYIVGNCCLFKMYENIFQDPLLDYLNFNKKKSPYIFKNLSHSFSDLYKIFKHI